MIKGSPAIDSFYTNFYAFNKDNFLSSEEIMYILYILKELDKNEHHLEINNFILKVSRYMSISNFSMLWLKEELVLKGIYEFTRMLSSDLNTDKDYISRSADFYSLKNNEIFESIASFNVFQRFMASYFGKLPFGIYF